MQIETCVRCEACNLRRLEHRWLRMMLFVSIVVSCSLVMLVVSSGEVNLLTPFTIARHLVSLVVVSLLVEVFL